MRLRLLAWTGTLWLLSLACTSTPELEEGVVLEIDGDSIALKEFEAHLEGSIQEEAPFMRGEIMAALFEEFIDERLLLKAAEDLGVRVGAGEVARELEKLSPLEGASEVPVEEDREILAKRVEDRLKVRRLVEREVLGELEVTEQEVRSYYQRHRDRYQREATMLLSQVLLEDETEAAGLREELLAAPELFQQKARESSRGPEAAQGGTLGSFRSGELPPAFEAAVEGLEPGQISEVVRTDFGYHIFRLDGRSPTEPLAFEEVADAIRVDLLQKKSNEAMAAYLEALRERYRITVHRDRLSFPFTGGETSSPGRS